MKSLMTVVRVAVIAVVTAAFFGVPYCWLGVKAQGLLWGALATLLFGRFFCRVLCPLGILQSFVGFLRHPKTQVRRVCTRLPETKAQRIFRWCVVAAAVALGACGCMGLVTAVLPISIFGKAVAAVRTAVDAPSFAQAFDTPEARLWVVISAVGLLVVLALAAVGKGRIWCNWVCPFGTIFSLVARFSLRRDKVGVGCGNCRRCMGKGMRDEGRGMRDEGRGMRNGGCVGRRETLKGVVLLAAADKLTDGGLAGVSLPGRPARTVPVLPPGAGKRAAFMLKCAACQLCVANCPGGCLKPSLKLNSFGQPEMDFRKGYCIPTCTRCGAVCPEGAIEHLVGVRRKDVHMGRAVWRKDLCIRTTEQTECTACSRKCPVRAIHIVKGFPVVDAVACIGCGACEHVCPSRPQPAISVEGYEEQRIVRPAADSVSVKTKGEGEVK